MRRYWTIVECKAAVVAFFGFCLSVVSLDAADCENGKGLTYNHITELVPGSDTLWVVATDEMNNAALSVIEGNGVLGQKIQDIGNWYSYSLRCRSGYGISGLSYGGGMAVATFYANDAGNANVKKTDLFLVFKTVNGAIKLKNEFNFPWPDSLFQDTAAIYSTVNGVWINGKFYFACLDGGMVRWDYDHESYDLFFPGNSTSKRVEDLVVTQTPDTMKRVTAVQKNGDTVVVTTPSKSWLFSTSDSSWDSSITSKIADSNLTFGQFEYIVPYRNHLYAVIQARKKTTRSITYIFAKYINSSHRWSCILEKNPDVISFAPGYVYIVTDSSTINVYSIFQSDSVVRNPAPVLNSSVFRKRMTPPEYGVDYPKIVHDIQFIPKNDSTGYLWIATSEGLYFFENEIPGVTEDYMVLIKRAPKVESGLKQTYARPGILTTGFDNGQSRTVFIYDLSKDAKVTIRIYDYNMDLVKTVISSRFRKAGKNGGPHGRSTVESEDWWDGRLNSGRMAAPGVYYYKITTDIGEHAFGKIVVAK